MAEVELLKLLGQSGIAVVALIILGRVVWRVGERMLVALDRVVSKIDEHTRTDTEAVGALREDVARIDSRLATLTEIKSLSATAGATNSAPPSRRQTRPHTAARGDE